MKLIDADAAVAEWYRINDIDENDRGARFVGYTEIPRWLYHIPTIDAEPVVRCKDCTHRYQHDSGRYFCEMYYGMGDVSDENYCSFGERREP